MNILITGVAGFIGANLAETLLNQGYAVIGIDNFITGSKKNAEQLSKFPNFKFLEHDITQLFPKSLDAKHYTFDAIYHLACPTGIPNLTRLGKEMLETCSQGTQNVIDLALKTNTRIVFTSSSEVYGDPHVSPQAENYTGNVDPMGIRSTYEEGKRFSESLIAFYVRSKGLNASIVRLFNTYGPRMSLDDTRVIPRFLIQAATNKPIPLHGEGKQQRTFCYVDDLVSALLTIMEKGKSGEAYNAGNDTQITIKELAELVIKITNSTSKISSIERPAHDHQSRLPNLTKLKNLGWEPKISLAKGVQKTFTWLKNLQKPTR